MNKKVILGCGNTKLEGYIGIDIADYGQDIVRDIRKGLPFNSNSCIEIIADQVLEHIESNNDFIFVMNECLRVLKNEGIMTIDVPYYNTRTAFKDPTHCRYFTKDTFTYFEKDNKWKYGIDNRWKVEYQELYGDNLKIGLIAKKI